MESHQPTSYRKPHDGTRSFDDDRNPILSVQFDYSATDHGGEHDAENLEAIRLAMAESAIRTLQFICAGDVTAQEAGRRAIIRLHLLRPQKTQGQLAAQLEMTAGRLSQILNIEKLKMAQCFQSDSSDSPKWN